MDVAVIISLIIFGFVVIVTVFGFGMLFYCFAKVVKQVTDATLDEMREDREQQKRMKVLKDEAGK